MDAVNDAAPASAPTLVSIALANVIPLMRDTHRDEFMKILTEDRDWRRELTTRLVKRARHTTSVLSSFDLVEMQRIGDPESYGLDTIETYLLKFGNLPFRTQRALQRIYKNYGTRAEPVSADVPIFFTCDGRLEIRIESGDYHLFEDAYIAECDDARLKNGTPNDNDMIPNTFEHDLKLLADERHDAFDLGMVEEMADFFIGAPPIHVETLDFDAMYARKPRVRIVIFDACPA